jgi:opine dehydrogenase
MEQPDGFVRLMEPAPRSRIAAFPGYRTEELASRLVDLMTPIITTNVLDPGLNNPNFLFHPAAILLNHAAIERQHGKLGIMNEGMTPGVLRALDALDTEKTTLMRALGLPAFRIDDLYQDETGRSPDIYRRQSPDGPRSAQREILPRFIDEDVSFGILIFSSLAANLGVPMPFTDAILSLLSVAEGRDLTAGGRTVERLGLAGLGPDQIDAYLQTGTRLS